MKNTYERLKPEYKKALEQYYAKPYPNTYAYAKERLEKYFSIGEVPFGVMVDLKFAVQACSQEFRGKNMTISEMYDMFYKPDEMESVKVDDFVIS
jgi:hypothetical protein